MPRYAGYHRIQAKRAANSVDESVLNVKKGPANLTSPSVSNLPTVARTTVQRAQTSPHNLTPQEVRQLQGNIGNRALSRMMAPQTLQRVPVPSTGPMLQRTASTVYRRTMPKYVIQRWKWPWRRGETREQKLERYSRTLSNIELAIDVLRIGHGIIMLPLTVIDLISNIARPFTGNELRVKANSKKEENRLTFHKALNGESMLVSLMGGASSYLNLKVLKYMPWNVIPWIMGALRRWYNKIDRKRRALA